MPLLQRLLRVGPALLALVLSGAAFGQITPQTPVTTRNPRLVPQSKILFTANRDLYVIHPDGTGLLNLTNDDLFDQSPVWSPDGSKIAFTTTENGYPYLRVVDADGRNLRKVYNQPANTTGSVVWSPNGASLAFTGGTNGYLYRINLDGTGLTQLTDFTVGNLDWGTNNRIVFNKTSPGVVNHPKPMFTQSGWMQIFSLDASRPALAEKNLNGDSSGLAQLTRGGMRKMDPFWSPDASKIAFLHLAAGGVVVSKGDGSQPDSVGDGWHHAWSRDGRKVVYVSSEGGGRLAVSTDGSRGTRLPLSEGAGRPISPSFSPDGQFIAYATTTANTATTVTEGWDSGQLMVIPAGGGPPRPLLPAGIRVAADTSGIPGYVGHRSVIWSPVVYDPTIQRLQTTPPAVSGARAQPPDSAPVPAPAAPSGKPAGEPTREPAAAARSARILLVDDDWSSNNADPAQTQLSPSDKLFRGLLDKGRQGKPLPYDVSVVPNYKDGPGAEVLQKYDLVIWYNGSSYGGNPDNTGVISVTDEANLRAYLDGGDRTLMLLSPGYLSNIQGYVPSARSNDAKWEVTESVFLKKYIGARGGQGLFSRFTEATVRALDGETYTVSRNSPLETQFSVLNPSTATPLFEVELNPDGQKKRLVPTATVNRIGSARCIYVGFTLEDIALKTEEAFQRLLALHFER